jgi:hypothetical protein
MTEDQIERAVERKYDRIDAQLMAGKLTQAEYDFEHKCIMRWAEDRYAGAPPVRSEREG